jgi:hypothetical protein
MTDTLEAIAALVGGVIVALAASALFLALLLLIKIIWRHL